MKKDLGVIPAVFPMPVLMVSTYDENGVVNVMNAAWGMNSDMNQISLFLTETHKTVQNIKAVKAFTVSIADKDHISEADYFGIASGNKTPDKFERTGLHAEKSKFVNAPVIEEFPLSIECELESIIKEDNYFVVVGKVLNVCAEERVLDENGKVNPQKLHAILFDQFQSGYYEIGEKVGQAWHDGKKYIEE